VPEITALFYGENQLSPCLIHHQEQYPELGQEEKLFFQQHSPFSNVAVVIADCHQFCDIFHSKTSLLPHFLVHDVAGIHWLSLEAVQSS